MFAVSTRKCFKLCLSLSSLSFVKPAQTERFEAVVVSVCHCVVSFPVACTGIHMRAAFPARLKKGFDRHYESVKQAAAAQPLQP